MSLYFLHCQREKGTFYITDRQARWQARAKAFLVIIDHTDCHRLDARSIFYGCLPASAEVCTGYPYAKSYSNVLVFQKK
jgi:hypothetical protein